MVRAWRAWAVLISVIALSLGSWLWHVSSNARTETGTPPEPVVPVELGFHEILLFMMYGFVERGLEHQGGFTTVVFSMMFCSIVILLYLCWKARRTEREQAKELVELQKLCDALWAEQRSDKERMRKLAEEATVLSQENAFLQMRHYEQDNVARIPREICVTDWGRCFHHRSCHTIRQSTFKAYYVCKECVTKFAADV